MSNEELLQQLVEGTNRLYHEDYDFLTVRAGRPMTADRALRRIAERLCEAEHKIAAAQEPPATVVREGTEVPRCLCGQSIVDGDKTMYPNSRCPIHGVEAQMPEGES